MTCKFGRRQRNRETSRVPRAMLDVGYFPPNTPPGILRAETTYRGVC